MSKYIMALDSGTTSNRCIIFDKDGNICEMAQKEFKQYYPKPGWVEHNAEDIWSGQLSVAVEAMAKMGLTASDIAAIGITNQRETTIVWDKNTSQPIYRAIVWQCRRTAGYCDELKRKGLGEKIRQKTGLMPDAYFSAAKIRWILDNVEGAAQKAADGNLMFGTVESWLIYKLSGGKVHVTDYSNASRTMLFNIHTLKWDEELLEIFGIPVSMLPKPVPSSGIYAKTDKRYFGESICIAGAAGDQQAALFGQCCFDAGEAKNTYGTGCFMLMNTGEKPVFSKNGLVTTIAWGLNNSINYALEGSVFVAGAGVQWLRDEMRLIDSAYDSEYMANKVEDTNGCYVVPAFTGLGAPYWDQYARGSISGLTRGVNKYHIIRAMLESVAYQVNDVFNAMEKDSGIGLRSLRADGGGSANNFIMQMQADICAVPVFRPTCIETTAMGAAYLAGLAVGYWKNIDEIRRNWKIEREFKPKLDKTVRLQKIYEWKKAVTKSFGWAKENGEKHIKYDSLEDIKEKDINIKENLKECSVKNNIETDIRNMYCEFSEYDFNELKKITSVLRSENGCSWDRKQTHESLVKCLEDECLEVISAIKNKDDDNLKEELGDVLLLILLNSQIASERGKFTIDDVIQTLGEKLIRRHPHVFGDKKADTPEECLAIWKEIKKLEKEQRGYKK